MCEPLQWMTVVNPCHCAMFGAMVDEMSSMSATVNTSNDLELLRFCPVLRHG